MEVQVVGGATGRILLCSSRSNLHHQMERAWVRCISAACSPGRNL
jgi:hypothetical protein